MTSTPTRCELPPADALQPRPACGSGTILALDLEQERLLVIPTYCKRWDCPHCGPRRLARARAMAAAGKPQRILTLTTRPDPGRTLPQAIRWIRKCLIKFLRRLRKEFGPTPYIAFLELHKSGWPHLHVLIRGTYMPQRMLSACWAKITGSWRVYVQQVKRTWRGVEEATKYYLKTATQVHDACPQVPVYTMSRDWLPPDWTEDGRPPASYTFYAFIPMDRDATVYLLEQLGATLQLSRQDPAHVEVRICGPPDPYAVSGIEACHDYAELTVLSALQTLLANGRGLAAPAPPPVTVEHLYDRAWQMA